MCFLPFSGYNAGSVSSLAGHSDVQTVSLPLDSSKTLGFEDDV